MDIQLTLNLLKKMNFKVVDHFIKGKSKTENLCEDKIVLSESYLCVIDGATSKSDIKFNGKSTGVIIGEVLESAIKKANPKLNHYQFMDYLSDYVKQFYVDQDVLEHMIVTPKDRLIATIGVYSIYKDEVWIVGDCQCLIDKIYYSKNKRIDEINSNVRSIIVEMELLKGKTISQLQEQDAGREFILPILKKQQIFQNAHYDNDLSYAVIDGFEIDRKKIKKISTANSTSIVIATDGYPMLFPSLIESEKHLQRIIKKDPLCFRLFKSTKGVYKNNLSFDDRAFLKIKK